MFRCIALPIQLLDLGPNLGSLRTKITSLYSLGLVLCLTYNLRKVFFFSDGYSERGDVMNLLMSQARTLWDIMVELTNSRPKFHAHPLITWRFCEEAVTPGMTFPRPLPRGCGQEDAYNFWACFCIEWSHDAFSVLFPLPLMGWRGLPGLVGGHIHGM